MTVISIDPGGKSGVAIRFNDGTIETCICESIFKNGKQETFDPRSLYELFLTYKFDHAVIETFQAQTITRYGLHTVRIVGGIEALCIAKDIPLTKHMPVDRYPFLQDAKDLLQGKRPMIHQVDALAHLLRWENDNNS